MLGPLNSFPLPPPSITRLLPNTMLNEKDACPSANSSEDESEETADSTLDAILCIRASLSLPLSVTSKHVDNPRNSSISDLFFHLDCMIMDLQDAINARIRTSIRWIAAHNDLKSDFHPSSHPIGGMKQLQEERDAAKVAFERRHDTVVFQCPALTESCDRLVQELVKRTHDNILRSYKEKGYNLRGYANPFAPRERRSHHPRRRQPFIPGKARSQRVSPVPGPSDLKAYCYWASFGDNDSTPSRRW
ncbi:hypothetical protein GYMLUDRAFT_273412 [Collybiopsis luxurians FD-317 M1]|nr:hypothetical protein GYMLUDRAFT_273412 [Collybiopsis luxurians FD-317 M1]